MKIKEVEQKLNITEKSIRYYEKEGLIHPKRADNNYREYSEEDVKMLQQIKILRILDFSVSDIKKLYHNQMRLEDAMREHIAQLERQKNEMAYLIQLCNEILEKNYSLTELDEAIFDENPEQLISRLRIIMKEDTTKEILTKKQLNFSVMALMVYGYLLSAAVAFIWGDRFLNYEGGGKGVLFLVTLFVAIYIVMFMTANMKIYLLMFHIAAVFQAPFIGVVFSTYVFPLYVYFKGSMSTSTFENIENTVVDQVCFAVFWLILACFCILLYLIYKFNKNAAQKIRFYLTAAVLFTACIVGISYLNTGLIAIPTFFMLCFTFYLSASWFEVNHYPDGKSRYFALVEGLKMLNIVGAFFRWWGRSKVVYDRSR